MLFRSQHNREDNVVMKILEDRILSEGVVKEGNVLKVDMFLNHQMDVKLFRQMGKEWKRLFAEDNVNKILTIEASGIGIACVAAEEFGCNVVFAKKTQSKNIDGELLTTKITSFTKGQVYDVIVAKKFLGPEDRVLIIDDFLANGCALEGLIQIVRDSGATLCGCGIAIEKGCQVGGKKIRDLGVKLESLAIIDKMENGTITFR